jgi:D-alanyl-lipoteichoic acid acyltransferase DltB (MBOAT superfamily)
MLFNSSHFLIFFPIVVLLFFSVKKVKFRQIMLLAASWYFYAAWKPEYIFLLLLSTTIDYIAAIRLDKTTQNKKRKLLVWLSIISNLSILFSFKYFHFFDRNLHRVLAHYDLFQGNAFEELLLPVGISFYTFQTISYTIDVYKRRIKAEPNFFKFALFVSFFPQLVAGPIERAGHLLPQFDKLSKFDYKRVSEGLKLMFWGFFQKIVIADSLSILVNTVYKNPDGYFGLDIWLATFFFAVQILCDFSGYTDIARGAAKILGYELMINFKLPYLAKSFAEFWKRWHISLSTWFRDYIYIQLGGNRVKTRVRYIFNIMFVFIVSGFWHGAGWTFIIWGALHGLYYVVEHYSPLKLSDSNNRIVKFFKIVFVFFLVNLAWIFFRSESVTISVTLLKNGFYFSHTSLNFDKLFLLKSFLLIGIVGIVSLIERKKDIISYISQKPALFRWSIYYVSAIILFAFGNFGIQEFIYFRF